MKDPKEGSDSEASSDYDMYKANEAQSASEAESSMSSSLHSTEGTPTFKIAEGMEDLPAAPSDPTFQVSEGFLDDLLGYPDQSSPQIHTVPPRSVSQIEGDPLNVQFEWPQGPQEPQEPQEDDSPIEKRSRSVPSPVHEAISDTGEDRLLGFLNMPSTVEQNSQIPAVLAMNVDSKAPKEEIALPEDTPTLSKNMSNQSQGQQVKDISERLLDILSTGRNNDAQTDKFLYHENERKESAKISQPSSTGQAPQRDEPPSVPQAQSRSTHSQTVQSSSSAIVLSERDDLLRKGQQQELILRQRYNQTQPYASGKRHSEQAQRPGFGCEGRPIKVKVNHFKLECTLKEVWQYNCTIELQPQPRQIQDSQTTQDNQMVLWRGRMTAEQAQRSKPLAFETRRNVIKALASREEWGLQWAYDGDKIIFTAARIFETISRVFQDLEARDHLTGKFRLFCVTVELNRRKPKCSIDRLIQHAQGSNEEDTAEDVVQALDIVIKHQALMDESCIVVGQARKIFNLSNHSSKDLGDGIEAWLGYKSSLRPGERDSQGCLTLNVDMVTTAFAKEEHVFDVLRRKAGGMADVQRLTDEQVSRAEKYLEGLKIWYHRASYTAIVRVKSITNMGASDLYFENPKGSGKMISVAQYFEECHKIRLACPQAPCINVGSRRQPNYIPTELCHVVAGQRLVRGIKLNERQIADILKLAAKKPADRAKFIEKAVTEEAKFPSDPVLKSFGVQVAPKMSEVDARVLKQPSIQCSKRILPPPDGIWSMKNAAFLSPARLQSFAICSFMTKRQVEDAPRASDMLSLSQFMWELMQVLQQNGLRLPEPARLPPVVYHRSDINYPGETVEEACKLAERCFRAPPEIIFVLLSDPGRERPDTVGGRGSLYSEIKRFSDSRLGIPSQCFQAKQAEIGRPISRKQDIYRRNLALKINAKLRGQNWFAMPAYGLVPWSDREPFMVLGADVSHSFSSAEKEPSIVAVCGSLDVSVTSFSTVLNVQEHRQEIIQGLQGMMRELLRRFYIFSNGRKPMRLVFYRHGISEGLHYKVQDFEIPQIQQACRDLEEGYNPKLTYIVVQRGHNTRLFPMRNMDADKSGNCLPGTVLDRGVVKIMDFDFILNSHAGIQGTNRPAHYIVLKDENGFSADAIQGLTYSLTYNYARCTRSVSICAPAYYAHLAALRGRCLISSFTPESTEEGALQISDLSQLQWAELAPPHENLNNTPYWL